VSLRAKLFAAFTLAGVLAVSVVAWIVSSSMRDAFERLDTQRTAALVAQFQREFRRRGAEVTERVEGIANSDDTVRMAVALGRAAPDYSDYVEAAAGLARAHQLDSLELITGDGAIVSSAQWPARFGYKEAWLTQSADYAAQGPFLKQEDLPDGVALALMAVRVVRAGDKKLFIAGGNRLDKGFLASLVLPAGMRALLYQNVGAVMQRPGPNAGRPYNNGTAAP